MSVVALRGVAAGTLIVAITILPMALCGVLIVSLSADLALTTEGLGVLFAVFFGSAAVSSPIVGRLTERIGPRVALRGGALAVAAASLAIGTVVQHWTALIPLIVVVGVGSALTRPGATVWIARVIPHHRQGLAIGVNHTSVLVAMLLAGLSVPTVAIPYGWRVAFLCAATLAVLAIFALPSQRRVGASEREPSPTAEASPVRENLPHRLLVLLTIAAVLGTVGASSLGAFTVPTLINAGLDESTSGTLVAASSVVGIAARIGAGMLADRRASIGLFGAMIMIIIGAGGFLLLGAPVAAIAMIGVPVAYATAWSWLGLFTLAILRLNPNTPGAALGIAQIGLFLGGVIGPLVLGVLAERLTFQIAWGFAATLAVGAAALVLLVDRRVRAPAGGLGSTNRAAAW